MFGPEDIRTPYKRMVQVKLVSPKKICLFLNILDHFGSENQSLFSYKQCESYPIHGNYLFFRYIECVCVSLREC